MTNEKLDLILEKLTNIENQMVTKEELRALTKQLDDVHSMICSIRKVIERDRLLQLG